MEPIKWTTLRVSNTDNWEVWVVPKYRRIHDWKENERKIIQDANSMKTHRIIILFNSIYHLEGFHNFQTQS